MNAFTNYTRLFPHLAKRPSVPNSETECGLAELGLLMVDEGGNEPGLPAGYTYLGQFIDHDLTLDLTPLDYAHPYADHIPNFRTPFLDLDHVYGGGPNLHSFLYEMRCAPGNERFLIGMTAEAKTPGYKPSLNDLPRSPAGIALVGDPRQDENLIIAQLHVAFLKLHNAIMDGLENGKIRSAGPAGATLFQQARRLVTWVYQFVVLNDFLQSFLFETVFVDILRRSLLPRRFHHSPFQIPLEFSLAGFRFGHSLVRDDYDYNRPQGSVDLRDLLNRTGAGPAGSVPVPADWVIAWGHFFRLSGPPHQDVRPINTMVAKGLHNLHLETVKLYKAPRCDDKSPIGEPKNSLPVRTLWRGARAGLPSGQDVARALGIEPMHPDKIATEPHRGTLIKYRFDEDTPLWYYILKEAEVLATATRLGPVGSHIVGNVILEALQRDPGSYVSVNPAWRPELAGRSIRFISDLLLFVS